MSKLEKLYQSIHDRLLSARAKEGGERIIVTIAIVSFVLHLVLIGLVDFDLIRINDPSKLLDNPIAAIYTPFSFILIYEVYLLVFYLPKSISNYIGKQYEIITLIVIRRIFKDLANLDLTSNWFQDEYDLQFTYDIIATILIFFLIYVFYRLNEKKQPEPEEGTDLSPAIQRFIKMKNIIAMLLAPTVLFLAVYSLGHWVNESFLSIREVVGVVRDVNEIFYDEFFTVLILVDVLLLLVSLYHTDKFHRVIRNSGFIISTVLIKLSFGVDGLLNTILIVVAVLFGVIMLWIHQRYERISAPEI